MSLSHVRDANGDGGADADVDSANTVALSAQPQNRSTDRPPFQSRTIAFFFLGLGLLLPWNAILSAVDYFVAIDPSIEYSIATSYTWTLLLLTVAMLPLPFRNRDAASSVPRRRRLAANWRRPSFSVRRRMATGYAVMSAACLILGAVPSPSASVILACTVAVAAGDAVAQSGLFVLAARIDRRCTIAVMVGNGCSGLMAGAWRSICKLLLVGRADVLVYFGASACVLGACVAIANGEAKTGGGPSYDAEDREERTVPEGGRLHMELQNLNGSETSERADGYGSGTDRHHSLPAPPPPLSPGPSPFSPAAFLKTLVAVRLAAASAFLALGVTLAIFPGVVSTVRPSRSQFWGGEEEGGWFAVALVTVFNVTDFVGRGLPGIPAVARFLPSPFDPDEEKTLPCDDGPDEAAAECGGGAVLRPAVSLAYPDSDGFGWKVLLPSVLRILFVPLFLSVAAASNLSDRGSAPSDASTLAAVALLGLSNGYICTACMTIGPAMIRSQWKDQRDRASIWLLVASFVGLAIGSSVGQMLQNSSERL